MTIGLVANVDPRGWCPGTMYKRPRECCAGGLIAREEEAEEVASQLSGASALPDGRARSNASSTSSWPRLVALACAITSSA